MSVVTVNLGGGQVAELEPDRYAVDRDFLDGLTAPAELDLPDELAIAGLYLLHFDPPYEHAGHYLGWAANIERRVAEHLAASSAASPLVRAAIAAGSVVSLARVWVGGDRTLERRLKRRHEGPRLCPLCRPVRRSRTCK